jgi:hypothetical protein
MPAANTTNLRMKKSPGMRQWRGRSIKRRGRPTGERGVYQYDRKYGQEGCLLIKPELRFLHPRSARVARTAAYGMSLLPLIWFARASVFQEIMGSGHHRPQFGCRTDMSDI